MGNETALGCDDDGGDGIQAGLQRRADKWNPPLRTAQAAMGRWLMAVCWRWEWGEEGREAARRPPLGPLAVARAVPLEGRGPRGFCQ